MPHRAPESAQKVVVQAEGKSQRGGEQELPPLQPERKLHLSEQTAEETARLLRLLVGERIHAAGHGDVAAVDG